MKRYMVVVMFIDTKEQFADFFDDYKEADIFWMDAVICDDAICEVYERIPVLDKDTGIELFSEYRLIYA